jgi:DNA polymerase II large subunit
MNAQVYESVKRVVNCGYCEYPTKVMPCVPGECIHCGNKYTWTVTISDLNNSMNPTWMLYTTEQKIIWDIDLNREDVFSNGI